MNKKDIKVGQKYLVVRTDEWLKTGSVVECTHLYKGDSDKYDAAYKVRISDIRDEKRGYGSNFKTASGKVSRTFKRFFLETKNLEPHDEITEVADPHKELKEAFAKGAQIQVRSLREPTSEWTVVRSPRWDTRCEYRIKPSIPHEELREAHAKGAKIEWRAGPHDSWMDAYSPWWLPEYEYRIKPEEPKFKEGDLCMFVGSNRPIPKYSTVRYIATKSAYDAIVQSGLIRICVRQDELKPLTPVGGMRIGDKLDVFAGRPNAGKSAFPFANLVMPDIAEAEPQYDVEMKVMKIRIRNAQTNPLQHEETPMKFETKYFLNGTDITNFSDMQLFAVIKDAEDAIAKLEDIKTQPKSLKQNIADRKAELAKLVEFLDKR